jgi:hypothetical protein
VEVDGNYIDAEPMKNRLAGSMVKSYLALWKRLTATGVIQQKTHLLNNEASEELKAEFKKTIRSNWCPPTTTVITQRKGQYKPSRVISKQY